jgi:hypothetical protein
VVTQASLNTEKHSLFVAANDPNTDVTVTFILLNAAGQQVGGTGGLRTSGDGNYSNTFTLSASLNPTKVKVTSSRGASVTAPLFLYRR